MKSAVKERKVSSENSGWGAGHTLTRVFAEKVTPRPESFPQPLSDMQDQQRKTHLGRAVGGISFLISIVYLLSLFISRSLHYLQYMSIEILQFL